MTFCELPDGGRMTPDAVPEPAMELSDDRGDIVLAGGCFWCTEAVYRALEGVTEVVSGYAGGSAGTASYEAVCRGDTGHAEAIRIRYNPQVIGLGEILRVFFAVAHDPTQVNRQGNDRGTQYRSAIFHADDAQREFAESYIDQLERAGVFRESIATTLEPLEAFYEAEGYHQDYAARNPGQPYIQMVSMPKVEKLQTFFSDKLKD